MWVFIPSMKSCILHGHLNNAPMLLCCPANGELFKYSHSNVSGRKCFFSSAFSQAPDCFNCSWYLLQTATTRRPENTIKHCSLGAVVVVSSFQFSSCVCARVCMCVCDAFPVPHHWMVLATELDRKWMSFCLQYYWCLVPRVKTTIIARVFSLSLRAVFFFLLFFLFCSSQSAGQLLQANEPCNIHLVPHCCFGAAGCQPFLLIVPASCAEASGSKKK